jgi:hypothetical protein
MGSELVRLDGLKRTSMVIDPPDGKIPPMAEQARERNRAVNRSFDSAKDRSVTERCLVGSTSGPPMLPVLYNNNYRIVQTPDAIMILVEMIHDVRLIRVSQRLVSVETWRTHFVSSRREPPTTIGHSQSARISFGVRGGKIR